MKNVELTAFKTHKTNENFYLDLFNLFTKSIPLEFLDTSKIIPFSIVRLVLSWYRLDKRETNLIMKKWEQLGLIEIMKFKGIKLRLNGNLELEGESRDK
jgi:hypothetical protein